MKHVTIQVEWAGPYSLDEADETDFGNGLYLFSGKQKHERNVQIQYCGITENSFKSRFSNHHKLPYINRDLGIWLGGISYPNNFSRAHMEIAEKIIVYFWQPSLNEKKKYSPPTPTTLISHWFKKDGAPRVNQLAIYKDLHDVLSWDGLHWRTGNLAVYTDD